MNPNQRGGLHMNVIEYSLDLAVFLFYMYAYYKANLFVGLCWGYLLALWKYYSYQVNEYLIALSFSTCIPAW